MLSVKYLHTVVGRQESVVVVNLIFKTVKKMHDHLEMENIS